MKSLPDITAGSRVMVVAPHPDDESLATGGLLCAISNASAAIRVIFLTNGDNNPWPQRVIERRWRIGGTDRLRWGTRRREEALQALEILKIAEEAACFLSYPDQGLTDMLMEGNKEPVEKLASLLEDFCPTLLITPALNDFHPDHSAAAAFIHQAIGLSAFNSTGLQWFEYLVHTGNGLAFASENVAFPLSRDQAARKRSAIACHTSQTALRPALPSLAERDETYHPVENAKPRIPFHPVHNACFETGQLRLEIQTSSSCKAFGPRSLYFVANQKGRAKGRFIMPLPSWPSRTITAIRDASTGRNVGLGYLLRHGRKLEIQMSSLVFGAIDQLFVKLERRFGFFDEAGWRTIPIGTESGSPTQVI